MRNKDNPNGSKYRRELFAALCAEGKSREAIAGEMCISIDTVREHARNRGIPLPHSEYVRPKAPKQPRVSNPTAKAGGL